MGLGERGWLESLGQTNLMGAREHGIIKQTREAPVKPRREDSDLDFTDSESDVTPVKESPGERLLNRALHTQSRSSPEPQRVLIDDRVEFNVDSNDTSSSKGAKFGDMMPKKKKKDAAPKVNLLHHSQPSCYGCGSILQTSEAEAPGYIAPETFAVDGEGGFDIVEERVDGIMQYRREAFVVLLIFFSVFGSVSSDDSYVFVSTKQNEVRTIALAAQDNYANTCELVSTCLSPQNCSRLECYPISNQSSETTCVYVNDNKWCNNRTGAPCNNVEANFLKGYVRGSGECEDDHHTKS
ncbi:unnamed protein product [Calypogeia fissa]